MEVSGPAFSFLTLLYALVGLKIFKNLWSPLASGSTQAAKKLQDIFETTLAPETSYAKARIFVRL